MGTEGGARGDDKRISSSEGSSDHKKGGAEADGGSRLRVGISGSGIVAKVDSKGSNRDNKKLETGTESEVGGGLSGSEDKGKMKGVSSPGKGRMSSGIRVSVCILKSTRTDCSSSGDSVCVLHSA